MNIAAGPDRARSQLSEQCRKVIDAPVPVLGLDAVPWRSMSKNIP
jgi:hypothetical protein